MTDPLKHEAASLLSEIAADFQQQWCSRHGDPADASRDDVACAYDEFCESNDVPASERNAAWLFVCDGFGFTRP